jgi:hypothetical protein
MPVSNGLTYTDFVKFSMDRVLQDLFTEMLEDADDEGETPYLLQERAKVMAHLASGWNPPPKGSKG